MYRTAKSLFVCKRKITLKQTQLAPTLPHESVCDGHLVARQARPYVKRIEQHGRVYVALNYGLSNCAIVEVEGGYVLIDAASSLAEAQAVRNEFDQRVNGEPQAIVYTHYHHDHIAGATAFHEADVPIWAHERFLEEFEQLIVFPRAYHARAAKQFGCGQPAEQVITNGIGPPLQIEEGNLQTFLLPTETFGQQTDLDFGGVHFQLRSAPGETRDQIFVWLPDERVLFAADNFYRAFPNLYAIRGGRPRPVREWIDSLDAMRRLEPSPEYLVLGHTDPIHGADTIQSLLTDYRDAIAFVHDSVVRGINAGKSPDELVQELELPTRLREHPYLQPLYGTLASAIRGVYAGYVGWFDGNATNLDPITPQEMAPKLVEQFGGRRGVLDAARKSLEQHDARWAAWLSDLCLLQDRRDASARDTKAAALSALAATTPNPLMRNWYMADAAILRNEYVEPKRAPLSAVTIQDIPVFNLLRRFPERLDPRRSGNVTMSVGLTFEDTGQQFTLFVRQGIGEVVDQLLPDTDLVIVMKELAFRRFLAREVNPASHEFRQTVKCEVPGSVVLSPFRRLYRLLRFVRCLQMP